MMLQIIRKLTALCFVVMTFEQYIITVVYAEDEVRCYCNTPRCVSTSYMCKSLIGRCYTSIKIIRKALARANHGCLDNLPSKHFSCSGTDAHSDSLITIQRRTSDPKADNTLVSGQPPVRNMLHNNNRMTSADTEKKIDLFRALLFCCEEDMCNYFEADELNGFFDNRRSVNDTLRIDWFKKDVLYRKSNNGADSESVLWFRAAVIAVPIAGGFILITLVILTMRMLHKDFREHRQLVQTRQNRNLFKDQMYVKNRFPELSIDTYPPIDMPLS